MIDPVEVTGFRFLDWGPRATSSGAGWHLAEDYFARCGRCSDLLRLWADQSEPCSCGGLYKDVDAGRFGLVDGDDSIAVYRQLS